MTDFFEEVKEIDRLLEIANRKDDDMTQSELDNNFTYHAPSPAQATQYTMLRAKAKELAEMFVVECPQSRECSLALTSLEQSVMWANAAIARNKSPQDREAMARSESQAIAHETGGVSRPTQVARSDGR